MTGSDGCVENGQIAAHVDHIHSEDCVQDHGKHRDSLPLGS